MIETFAAVGELDCATLTASEYRTTFNGPSARREYPGLSKIEDRVIEGAAGAMRVRLYYPDVMGPLPMTLYIHGGGFINGSPESTDGVCSALAVGASCIVISPDYRLAPETPFPGGLDDVWMTLLWMTDQALEIGGDVGRLAVAGDSSGGQFAAVLAQMARKIGRRICCQVLLYPAIDNACDTPSYQACAKGYFLTADLMKWFWRQYLPDSATADWRAWPLRTTIPAGLAPAYIMTAEYDVLRDEAEAYAVRLVEAGVQVTVKRWTGQIHGFLLLQGEMSEADAALSEAATALRAAFGSS